MRLGIRSPADDTAAFQSAVDQVREEGRWRVFADLKRVRGQCLKAVRRCEDRSEQDGVIGGSNDDPGMGRHLAFESVYSMGGDIAGPAGTIAPSVKRQIVSTLLSALDRRRP
jgi:5-aminolevulinate synthase